MGHQALVGGQRGNREPKSISVDPHVTSKGAAAFKLKVAIIREVPDVRHDSWMLHNGLLNAPQNLTIHAPQTPLLILRYESRDENMLVPIQEGDHLSIPEVSIVNIVATKGDRKAQECNTEK